MGTGSVLVDGLDIRVFVKPVGSETAALPLYYWVLIYWPWIPSTGLYCSSTNCHFTKYCRAV